MISPARYAAHRVLRDVHTEIYDLPQALDKHLASLADSRDRGLATEIATGTLRRRSILDSFLAKFSSRDLDSLDRDVLDILRGALYQLVYLDRIPCHAIVNDAVSMTRSLKKTSAAGFVNAILRKSTKTSFIDGAPERPKDYSKNNFPRNPIESRHALEYLVTTQSHPSWLVKRLLDRYGFSATERWCTFNNQPAPITLRVNPLKTDTDTLIKKLQGYGIKTEAGRFSSSTLIAIQGNPLTTDLFQKGWFLAQDEASQLISELILAGPKDVALDLCASPGGKTVAISGAMSNNGILVATDLRERRVSLLEQTLSRLSVKNARIVRLDGRKRLPFPAVFDWVLVDAPCSGLGTLRTNPDIRWRSSEEQLHSFALDQKALIASGAAVVSPGGHLIYATCSSEPEENENVVNSFLADHRNFELETPRNERFLSLLTPEGFFHTLPHRDHLQAFFAAVLIRKS